MIGFIYAPFVALIVWYVAGQYGLDIGYWQTLVLALVAKVVALYLKNDNDVKITVNTKGKANDNPKEDE
jgi:phosphate starvation-inducible membrane PsiE